LKIEGFKTDEWQQAASRQQRAAQSSIVNPSMRYSIIIDAINNPQFTDTI
jgi:hypothetical protein